MDCQRTYPRQQLRLRGLASLLAGALLATSGPLAAAQRDLFELSLEELGQVNITGSTLTAKKLSDVPAAVTVFTREEIRQLPVSSVEQLMNYVPGFQAARSSDNSISQPYSVRGRKLGVSGREVLVMINGMRIENFFTGGAASTYPQIPLANVERIEFIRGPGSSLYGSNALTGMVNIITDEAGSRFYLNGGTPEQASASWLHQFGGDNAGGSLFVQGTRASGEDYRVQDSFSPQTVMTSDPQQGREALLQLRLSQDTRLQLLATDRDMDDFYVTGFVANGFNSYDTRYYHGMLEHTLQLSPALSSKLQAGYSRFRMLVDTQSTPPGALAAISSPASNEPVRFYSETVTTESWARWLNDWTLNESHTLQFGASYRNPGIEQSQLDSNFDLAALYRGELPIAYRADFGNRVDTTEAADMDVASAFLQYQSRWTEQAELVLGVRYDSYSQVGSHVSPRAALTLHPNSSDSVKLLYGRAFDAPVAAELYTINNTILLGNPDLQPETVDTWELLWLRQWQNASFTTSYFYNRFHDSISQALVEGIRTYENAGHETSDGIETELAVQLNPAFSLRATGTYLFNQVTSSFRESDQLFSLIGRVQQPFGYATLALNHQSDRQTLSNNGNRRENLDGFWLANLKFGYYLAQNLETYLEVQNVTDEAYFTPSVSGNIAAGIPNHRRELRLGFVWDYSR